MKEYIKRVISIVIVVLVTLVAVVHLGNRLDPKFIPISQAKIRAFHSLPENSLDVIVYGSSHAYKGFDTRVLSDEYNINAYNYGLDWQHMNTTRLFLKDSLYVQNPKVVLIETYKPKLLKDHDLNGEIFYTRFLPNTPARKEYLKQCFGENIGRYISYYFPLAAFHDNWSCIERENFTNFDTYEQTFTNSRGYFVTNEVKEVKLEDYTTYEQTQFDSDTLEVLNDMVKLCHDKGIEVIFFTTPSGKAYGYFDAFEEYAVANDCKYINFMDISGEYQIDPTTDFQDKEHLNESGAQKVARFFGEYLTEKH